MPIFLALMCALTYGSGDFVGGLAARRVHPVAVGWVSHTMMLAPITVVAVLVGASHVGHNAVVWGVVGGLSGAIGMILLYVALGRSPMSIAAPVAALVSVATSVIVGAWRGERPSWVQWVGVVAAMMAISAVTGGWQRSRPSKLAKATAAASLGAGLGIGFLFVALDRAGDDSGFWPLVFGRLASAVVLGGLVCTVPFARSRVFTDQLRPTLRLIGVAALLDLVANSLYLFAVRGGLLSIVSVIASLYPASTVLLANRVLRERVGRTQQVGLAVAALAIALVAGG